MISGLVRLVQLWWVGLALVILAGCSGAVKRLCVEQRAELIGATPQTMVQTTCVGVPTDDGGAVPLPLPGLGLP